VRKPTAASQVASVLGLGVTVIVVTGLVYVSGTNGIAVHFYYLPIIFAGYAFGDYGAILVSLLCGALCGPWMPGGYDGDVKVPQGQWDIILRSLIFYVIGIAASRTFHELKRRINEANTLYDVARSINSTLRLREVLALIAQHAVNVMGARACSIRLLSKDTDELELAARHGLSDEYAAKGPVSLEGSGLDKEALAGEVIAIPDVRSDPRFQYPQAAEREGIVSVLTAPLTSKDEALGVIRIYGSRMGRYRPRDVALLQGFAGQAALAIENAELYEDIRRNYYETVRALTIAIEAKDSATYSHSERVTELATRLAQALGMPNDEVELLRFGSILHDIGKIGVAEGVLDARDGPIETQVFYRMHPLIGRSILQPITFLHSVLPVVTGHHENWDGSGFPSSLRGTDIPRLARIVAVADAYERLISPDPGSQHVGLGPREAMNQVLSQAGTRFDPEIVATFHRMIVKGTAVDG
jgi:putative nucleotidyltransferase with HDIG domain